MGDYATTELSDALIKLGVKHGGYLPDIQQYSPVGAVRISGPAYTVQMVPFNDTTSPKPTQHFVDAAPAGHVIVISVPSGEPRQGQASELLLFTFHFSFFTYFYFSILNRCKVGSVGRADDAWRAIAQGGGRGGCWSM